MIIQGQVGPSATTASLAPSSQPVMRLGNMGDQIVSELHGKYYETTYRRNMFFGGIVGQTTTVGLATTYTGLCLSNPIGSPVNIVITQAGYAFLVAFAAASSVGIMTGYNSGTNVTHTTPVTVRSQFVGIGQAGVGLLDSASTLPTAPFINTVFGAGLTGAITTTPFGVGGLVDINGMIILPPGAYAAFYTSTASGTNSSSFSFSWEEIPV